MTVPCRQAGAVATVPISNQNQRQEGHGRGEGPVEVRRHHDQEQPAVPQQQEHGGYVYKQLGDCPARGTVSDLLEWAVPTAANRTA